MRILYITLNLAVLLILVDVNDEYVYALKKNRKID